MCRSRAQGGQRCFGHAKERLSAATQAYGQAITDGMDIETDLEDRITRVKEAHDRLTAAEEDFASTPAGHAQLVSALEQPTPPEVRTRVTNSLLVGEHLRERNRIVHRAAAALDAGEPPPGSTDTIGTATAVRDALRSVRDQPDRYRQPLPDTERVIGVKTYRTSAEQARGVRRWEQAVDQAAAYMQTARHITIPGNAGPRELDHYSRRFAQRAYRLVLLSDRLARARAQTPPQ